MKTYIKDLQTAAVIDSTFAIKTKDLRKTQKGDPYVSLKLGDKTGDIDARWWDNFADIWPTLIDGAIIRVWAEVSDYQGAKQLTIRKATLADQALVDPTDYLPATTRNTEEIFLSVQGIIASISDTDIRTVLESFLQDQAFVAKLKKAPAATNMHSACIGGLLEHLEGMFATALFLASQYPSLNRDYLLAGVFLHDLGKVAELSYTTTIKYTDEGKLVGHIVMGIKMLNEKINALSNFPAEKRIVLEHLILSHHGQLEFGSPKLPMTIEAVVLHYIDNIDAKILGFNEFIAANKVDNHWSPKAFLFDNRQMYIP